MTKNKLIEFLEQHFTVISGVAGLIFTVLLISSMNQHLRGDKNTTLAVSAFLELIELKRAVEVASIARQDIVKPSIEELVREGLLPNNYFQSKVRKWSPSIQYLEKQTMFSIQLEDEGVCESALASVHEILPDATNEDRGEKLECNGANLMLDWTHR